MGTGWIGRLLPLRVRQSSGLSRSLSLLNGQILFLHNHLQIRSWGEAMVKHREELRARSRLARTSRSKVYLTDEGRYGN